jgi:hypothetical protein
LSTRATAGFNVFIELSVVHVVPHMIADCLAATEPVDRMMTGNFNLLKARQDLPGSTSPRDTHETKEIGHSGWHETLYVWQASMHPLA